MLGNKFKEVIRNVEKHISDKEECSYVKEQITMLTMSYLNELEKLEQNYDSKISRCSERIDDLEKSLDSILADNEKNDEELDVEPITCPYCNSRFLIEFNNKQNEVRCPSCRNIIELDWDVEEDDM